MHSFVSFNHQFYPAAEVNLNAVSYAALYGKGIFTTLAIYDKKPFLWEKHWRRLNENAAKVGIDLSNYSEINVKNSLEELVNQNKAKNARARITFFDESPSKTWTFNAKNKTSLLIQTADAKKTKENLTLDVSRFPVNSASPLAGVKSCNYLENILALEDAKSFKFDEALRYNERNELTSACMANVFWYEYENDKLFTPSLKTGCLPGTIREFILENYEVVEVEKEINKFFRDAETVFLTSSGIGIVQVSEASGIEFSREPHDLTQLIPI